MGDGVKDGYLTVSGYTVLGIKTGQSRWRIIKLVMFQKMGPFLQVTMKSETGLYSFADGADLRKIGNSLFSPEGSGGNLLESPSLTVGALEGLYY